MKRKISRGNTAFFIGVLPLLLSTLLLASGCTTYSDKRNVFKQYVRVGNYQAAMNNLTEEKPEDIDLVVEYMNRGMVLHLMGQYQESNQWLKRAEVKLEDLYTESVSEILESIAWNDSSKSYRGEDFEQVLISLIKAFNYLSMPESDNMDRRKRLEAAQVEVNMMNHRLKMIVRRLEDNELKTQYDDDAFAHYMSGLILEAMGRENDALISYIKAYDAYKNFEARFGVPVPEQIKQDLLRTSAMYQPDRYNQYKELFAGVPETSPLDAEQGEMIALIGLGQIAYKESRYWQHTDADGDIIKVTYPEFVDTPYVARNATVTVDGNSYYPQVVHDLSAIAKSVLADRNSQVKGKAVARAIILYAAKKAARVAAQSDNQWVALSGLVANIALNVRDILEVADTRSWISLPSEYRMVRIKLPPGEHQLVFDIQDGAGNILYQETRVVNVGKGLREFVVLHSHDPGSAGPVAQK